MVVMMAVAGAAVEVCWCLYLYMQGGRPSPFDRNMGSRMAIKCAEKLLEQIQASKTPEGQLPLDAA